MTVWAEDSESQVQIEIGVDATDIWMAFNKSTAVVQMTHAECRELIKQLEEALQFREVGDV